MRLLLSIMVLLGAVSARAEFDWYPFHEQLTATNGAVFEAWRPLYSASVDGERWQKDFLWPVYTQKGFKDERYGRFLFFGFSTDFAADTDRCRNWILPFYFHGTSAGGEDYFALFPFGGTIREFLGRDKVSFVLFPLYAESNINDVHTTTVLWPIGSKTSGEGIERFRIWPFYGASSLEDEFDKKFVLWPIYTSVQYTNERNPGGGFILMPIYGRVITEKAESHWFAAPFFRYMHSDEQWIVHAPWPFVQLAGGTMHKRIFWPVYGKKRLGPHTRRYWLWPIVWNNKTQYAHHDRHRRLLVPFFASVSDVATTATKDHAVGDVASRYWKLWPLMSWERNREDSRFRLLELWPLRNTPGIERNWAPLWTLYRRTNTGGETGHHLLWGVYRQTRGKGRFEWSLLKGLAGYRRSEQTSSFRFLFMTFGEEEELP